MKRNCLTVVFVLILLLLFSSCNNKTNLITSSNSSEISNGSLSSLDSSNKATNKNNFDKEMLYLENRIEEKAKNYLSSDGLIMGGSGVEYYRPARFVDSDMPDTEEVHQRVQEDNTGKYDADKAQKEIMGIIPGYNTYTLFTQRYKGDNGYSLIDSYIFSQRGDYLSKFTAESIVSFKDESNLSFLNTHVAHEDFPGGYREDYVPVLPNGNHPKGYDEKLKYLFLATAGPPYYYVGRLFEPELKGNYGYLEGLPIALSWDFNFIPTEFITATPRDVTSWEQCVFFDNNNGFYFKPPTEEGVIYGEFPGLLVMGNHKDQEYLNLLFEIEPLYDDRFGTIFWNNLVKEKMIIQHKNNIYTYNSLGEKEKHNIVDYMNGRWCLLGYNTGIIEDSSDNLYFFRGIEKFKPDNMKLIYNFFENYDWFYNCYRVGGTADNPINRIHKKDNHDIARLFKCEDQNLVSISEEFIYHEDINTINKELFFAQYLDTENFVVLNYNTGVPCFDPELYKITRTYGNYCEGSFKGKDFRGIIDYENERILDFEAVMDRIIRTFNDMVNWYKNKTRRLSKISSSGFLFALLNSA